MQDLFERLVLSYYCIVLKYKQGLANYHCKAFYCIMY